MKWLITEDNLIKVALSIFISFHGYILCGLSDCQSRRFSTEADECCLTCRILKILPVLINDKIQYQITR